MLIIPSLTAGVLVFLFTSLGSLCVFHDAIEHLFCLGKSKTKIKKLKRAYSWFQRRRLKHIIENISECNYHIKTLKALILSRKIYLYMELLCILAIAISILRILPWEIAFWLLIGKTIAIDGTICAYRFIMTKHGKNGGVVWRWTKY